MIGINIYEGKKPSALRHIISLRRQFLKVEQRGIFAHIFIGLILVPHKKDEKLCQLKNKPHSFSS